MPTGTDEPSVPARASGRTGRRAGADAPSAERPPRAVFIERSHERSAALGLSRGEKCEFGPLVPSDLNIARERNRRLHLHAAPIMHMLFEQIVDTQSMIVLTDAQGTILHAVGDDDFLRRADKVALAPGENWAEYSKGTNAIGTALFEEVPTLVHAHEHYIHANHFLTCSASPIFDPRGNVLGVLDVTGDHRSYHQHTMGLVRMSARMIENHWLSEDCNHQLRVHFHTRPEFLGSLLEGIVVLGADGRVQGANRGAVDLLGMDSSDLRSHTLASLFGTTPAAVFDHFRAQIASPLALRLPCGRLVHAVAGFENSGHSFGVGASAPPRWLEPGSVAPPRPQHAKATGRRSRSTALHDLETGDLQMGSLLQKIRRVLDRDVALLITGETGTGKSSLARAVHEASSRAAKPFVSVNCAAMPEAALEVELFGADRDARGEAAPGCIVRADGGTLFLDEVDEMPPAVQARLLQVLQDRCVTPPGARAASPRLDFAIISATRGDLRVRVGAHGLRDALYYRLNGLSLRLPALRERTDLDGLAQRILRFERPEPSPRLAAEVMQLFRRHPWPGNLRQFANVVRAAVLMAADEAEITLAHLADDFLDEATYPVPRAGATGGDDPRVGPRHDVGSHVYAAARGDGATVLVQPHTLEQAEIAMIHAALDAAQGNISAASKQLGISRNTIYRRLRWNAHDRCQ